MDTLLEFLGFTTIASIVWNAISYIAFIAIIVGVFSERYRNTLITLGAVALAPYAWIFLDSSLFATLQVLIVVSGILQLTKVSKRPAVIVMLTLTTAAYVFLFAGGAIVDAWALMGSFGLLGIVFGLTVLPKRYGFVLMIAGGVLLIFYAFHTAAWVFFFLNIFFSIANLYIWQKARIDKFLQ
ncbi:MAG: hypothetical protein BMS9Abin13_387 [Patescibacteria group bacterium]|nr:MAG: hypothetical protein BMS9Abin13_387 [Patescibacteria group bacterium]